MKNVRLLLVCSIAIISASCQTTGRFNRPKVTQCWGLSDGKAFCIHPDGKEEEVDPVGFVMTSPDDYEVIETYVDSIELRLEKCIRDPKRCQ
ncbi:MAG: hypothetical protein AB7I27_00320 [Bacteriovoracaceae bacterium]